jgi:hypothetical protein
MYFGEMESNFLSLAEKHDLPPSTLANLGSSSSIAMRQLFVVDCYNMLYIYCGEMEYKTLVLLGI